MVADDKGAGSQLVKALIAAKKEFKPLVKNKVNPHFRSKYADLAAVHDAVDAALAANGLTIMQPMQIGQQSHVILTKLLHVSGEEVVSAYPLPGGVKSQELASAITYGRRYSLCALLGIPADDDDDGEAAESRTTAPAKREAPKAEKPATKDEPPKDRWVGHVSKVEELSNGRWKVIPLDNASPVFGTVTPEHADVARSLMKTKGKAVVKFKAQANGTPLIVTIEPEMKEEKSNG